MATMTGSTTTQAREWWSNAEATHSIIELLANIPVFTASAPISVSTASIWARMTSVGTSWMADTPVVFWAVMAVMVEVP